jgi:hypothetical protein
MIRVGPLQGVQVVPIQAVLAIAVLHREQFATEGQSKPLSPDRERAGAATLIVNSQRG